MEKPMRLIALTTFMMAFTVPLYAADEFGTRFSTETPTALEDAAKDPAEALADIMPAAGDEAPTDTEKNEDDIYYNDGGVYDPKADPAAKNPGNQPE